MGETVVVNTSRITLIKLIPRHKICLLSRKNNPVGYLGIDFNTHQTSLIKTATKRGNPT